jgi:ADP-ribose pyrophosphatase YjhB (NUDIX family)
VTGREYPARPIVGIGIVVLRAGSVVLVRRGKAPNPGGWTLPGGAQELGETAEAAARRELAEETGLSVGTLHLAGTVDLIRPDPDGRVRYHYTIIDFAALWVSGEPRAGDDAAETAWAPLDRLEDHALTADALRIIGVARRLLGC